MKKRFLLTGIIMLTFFTVLGLTLAFAEQDAAEIREGVLRFHIVAESDSEYDQTNKLSVRDGIAELCSELFGNADSKTEAATIASENSGIIASRAEDILRERGCDDSVKVLIRKRFFPTRRYDGVSLPAGVYDTVDVAIGSASGENFWCVMFPDICLNASTTDANRGKMSGVLHGPALSMATDTESPAVKFRFRIVELFESFKNFILRN